MLWMLKESWHLKIVSNYNPNEEGRVVAEVQRNDEGHVSINYRSEVAKHDHLIQQAIWDAIAQLQTIPALPQSLSCF